MKVNLNSFSESDSYSEFDEKGNAIKVELKCGIIIHFTDEEYLNLIQDEVIIFKNINYSLNEDEKYVKIFTLENLSMLDYNNEIKKQEVIKLLRSSVISCANTVISRFNSI